MRWKGKIKRKKGNLLLGKVHLEKKVRRESKTNKKSGKTSKKNAFFKAINLKKIWRAMPRRGA